jgi:hypothetical protein
MSRIARTYVRDIALYTAGELIAIQLENWARRGSTERRDAAARAVGAERALRIEGLFKAVSPFTRKKRSSAEIIAAEVLGRRKTAWRPF